jgi:hypothetical protein
MRKRKSKKRVIIIDTISPEVKKAIESRRWGRDQKRQNIVLKPAEYVPEQRLIKKT